MKEIQRLEFESKNKLSNKKEYPTKNFIEADASSAAKNQKDSDYDPLIEIRNDDMRDRIATRYENENVFDNLLSGTTATLIIQTQKKLYIGWVGDS